MPIYNTVYLAAISFHKIFISPHTGETEEVMQKQYIQTKLGTWEAIWSNSGLYELNFPQKEFKPSLPTNQEQKEFAKQLEAYCASHTYSFDGIAVDFSGYTEFAAQVLQACRQIKHGHTDTYKNLAALTGRPKAYRAVGNIMSNNRTPLIIPCHRVLGSSGKLCGFAGGLDMKRTLLDLEANK